MKKTNQKLNDNRDDIRLDSLNEELGSFGLKPPKIYSDIEAPIKDEDYTPAHTKKKIKTPKSKKPVKPNQKALTKEEKNVIHKKKRKLKKKVRKLIAIFSVILGAILVFVILSLTVLFKVDTIKVEGSEHYTQKQIVSVLPIQKEDNLFLIKKGVAKEKLCESLPYIYDVEITRKIPSTINVKIIEPEFVYYVKNSDNTYTYLDDNFKAIEVNAKKKPKDGIEIKKLALSKAVEGKTVDITNQKLIDDLDALMQVVSDVKLTEATAIYSENINNNYFVYDNRIIIKIGSTNDAEDKLYSALASIEKLNEANPEAEGTMTSTGGKQIYFTEKK